MSSSIHEDLLNLKNKLTVGDSSSSSRRLVEDLQKKYESRITQDTLFNIKVQNRSAEDHFSSTLIQDQEGTKGIKAFKITTDGNCLYNLPCLYTARAYRPFTLHCVYISKNFGICLVMVFKVPRLLPTIEATTLSPVTISPPSPVTKKEKPHIEQQVASHLEPPSSLLTLELNPLAHLFIFTRSYFPSAFHCC